MITAKHNIQLTLSFVLKKMFASSVLNFQLHAMNNCIINIFVPEKNTLPPMSIEPQTGSSAPSSKSLI
jgi:hypothetical protein